jgi:EpsI family protein
MTAVRVAMMMAVLMTLAAVGALAARPAPPPPGTAPRYLLEDMVPKNFGDWHAVPEATQVVNPQTKELLDKLYSQLLSRTYVNSKGYRVMLSLAYGDQQRGELQAHKPETCYPAQGFKLLSNVESTVKTPYGDIAARRLNTVLGPRQEPITYWFTVGDTRVKNVVEQRIVEVKLGLTGQIPDGLLFRVSSIDDKTARAYPLHDAFVADLLKAVSPIDRKRLSGLVAGSEGA